MSVKEAFSSSSVSSCPHPISEKVVVVTGASAGIGAAIAKYFSEVGYRKMVLVSRGLANEMMMKGLEKVSSTPPPGGPKEAQAGGGVGGVQGQGGQAGKMAVFF